MWHTWLILAAAGQLLLALFARWVTTTFRGPDDVDAGLVIRANDIYVRLFHGLRVTGRGNIPQSRNPGPLIVVLNHTAGIDPMLAQSACPFEIRWLMDAGMRIPFLEPLWQHGRIIFVDQQGRDVTGAREAIRHVKAAGVLGIFPEGGLERPPRHILPFEAGVGLLIRRTGAPVLPVIIEGTPVAEPAWASIFRFSRSHVRFMPIIEYGRTLLSAEEIATDLRERYLNWTGWPPAEKTVP